MTSPRLITVAVYPGDVLPVADFPGQTMTIVGYDGRDVLATIGDDPTQYIVPNACWGPLTAKERTSC